MFEAWDEWIDWYLGYQNRKPQEATPRMQIFFFQIGQTVRFWSWDSSLLLIMWCGLLVVRSYFSDENLSPLTKILLEGFISGYLIYFFVEIIPGIRKRLNQTRIIAREIDKILFSLDEIKKWLVEENLAFLDQQALDQQALDYAKKGLRMESPFSSLISRLNVRNTPRTGARYLKAPPKDIDPDKLPGGRTSFFPENESLVRERWEHFDKMFKEGEYYNLGDTILLKFIKLLPDLKNLERRSAILSLAELEPDLMYVIASLAQKDWQTRFNPVFQPRSARIVGTYFEDVEEKLREIHEKLYWK